MRIVTLLTDWQKDDYYIAVVKAALLSKISDIQFVDISHQVNTFHIPQAALILKSALHQFPEGSIHLFGVQTANTENSKLIVAQFNKQFIIGTDNGIFDALGLSFDTLITVDKSKSTFPVLEDFVPIAIRILKGEALNLIGKEIAETLHFPLVKPSVSDNMISCPVSYIDSYGNLIIDIRKDFFESIRKNRNFEILINSMKHKTNRIHQNYSEVPKSEIFSIFNSSGWLEIGIRMGNISQILNINEKSNIIIKFFEV